MRLSLQGRSVKILPISADFTSPLVALACRSDRLRRQASPNKLTYNATSAPLCANSEAFLKAGYKVWEPSRPSFRRSGLLILSPKLEERISTPAGADHDQLRAQTRATLDAYVENGTDALRLFKRLSKKLKLYELRILDPKPGARLIGGFIDTDTFVAVDFYTRDELPFKKTGQAGRIHWPDVVDDALNRWNAIVPNVPRIHVDPN